MFWYKIPGSSVWPQTHDRKEDDLEIEILLSSTTQVLELQVCCSTTPHIFHCWRSRPRIRNLDYWKLSKHSTNWVTAPALSSSISSILSNIHSGSIERSFYYNSKDNSVWLWWHIRIMSTFRKLKQGDFKPQASLDLQCGTWYQKMLVHSLFSH